MYDVIAFQNLVRFRPSRKREASVFIKLHSGERSWCFRVDGKLKRRESLRFQNIRIRQCGQSLSKVLSQCIAEH